MDPSAAGLILVVEDDDDIREFSVKTLRAEGYRVLEAANGGVALVLLGQDLPIRVLFTDIVMPGEPDGLDLAERARALRPDLKILYTTGFTAAARLDGHRVYGSVLSKPYRGQELADEVARLIA
jgi:CheY-like chemotaxis protein